MKCLILQIRSRNYFITRPPISMFLYAFSHSQKRLILKYQSTIPPSYLSNTFHRLTLWIKCYQMLTELLNLSIYEHHETTKKRNNINSNEELNSTRISTGNKKSAVFKIVNIDLFGSSIKTRSSSDLLIYI